MFLRPRPRTFALFAGLAIAALLALLVLVSPSPPELRIDGSPFTLRGPVLIYWLANGGREKLGPPRSDLLWIDGQQTQFFDTVMLRIAGGQARPEPQPANWRDHLPPEVLTTAASPFQAKLAPLDQPTVQPLAPLTIRFTAARYEGAVEMRLYDANHHPAGSFSGNISGGNGDTTLLPGGTLGPQQVVVLLDGRIAAVQNAAYTLAADTTVTTGSPRYDSLFTLARGFLSRSALQYQLEGRTVHGYRSPDSEMLWLRDHTYQARAARLFDPDMTSLLDAFRRAQLPDGSFPDFLAWPAKSVTARRMPVEADVEYLFVTAVYEAWQATGDDAWLRAYLPALRRALQYTISNPLRWDAAHGLVKRPYTIDTWDFEIGPTTVSPDDGRPAPRHWIDGKTHWSIFHGDNTGLARALRLMSRMEARVGDSARAQAWRDQADGIMKRLNALSWNGKFFTHQVPLTPLTVPGVDTATQLSLSNALALNRGVLERTQARAIVEEYYQRYQNRGPSFAEWYGIDPPFPAGTFGLGGRKGERPGEYVNGGLLPLVGGELARGAFGVGSEAYGLDILARYTSLITATNSSYLWYFPAGNPGISGSDTIPYDGWGSGAMLAALIEGAGGIADNGAAFADATISPRWTPDDSLTQVRVVARYPASGGYVAYTWQRSGNTISVRCTGSGQKLRLRVLVPRKKKPTAVLVNGVSVPLTIDDINGSRYAVVDLPGSGTVQVSW